MNQKYGQLHIPEIGTPIQVPESLFDEMKGFFHNAKKHRE